MKTSISNNIRKIRQWKGYSQQKMADKLSMSQAAYCDIESGQTKITAEKLEKIAEALEVSSDVIENLNESVVFNSCKNSGLYNVYNISGEEIKDLYAEVISSLKDQIENLKLLLAAKDELIKNLKKES